MMRENRWSNIATPTADKVVEDGSRTGKGLYNEILTAFCKDWVDAYVSASPEKREEMFSNLFGKEVE